MLLNEVLEKYNSIMSIYMVDEEEGVKELELFKKEFETKFKIVPKEEFGVIFNREDAGRLVCGGFSSKEEAERYKDGWNKKAEESIEETLAKNPDAEISDCSYLTVAKIQPIPENHREWFKFDKEIKEEKYATNE